MHSLKDLIKYRNIHLLTHALWPIMHFYPHLSTIFRLREQAAYSSSSLFSSQFRYRPELAELFAAQLIKMITKNEFYKPNSLVRLIPDLPNVKTKTRGAELRVGCIRLIQYP